MYKRTELINVDSDVSEESVEIATKTKDKKERSWVYLHSKKREFKGKEVFNCLVQISESGKLCNQRFDASGGNTTTISNHLKARFEACKEITSNYFNV
jgi:hypothetical protein